MGLLYSREEAEEAGYSRWALQGGRFL